MILRAQRLKRLRDFLVLCRVAVNVRIRQQPKNGVFRTMSGNKPFNYVSALRRLPLVLILMVAAIGAALFGDRVTFELLREYRAVFLAWRDGHGLLLAVAFVAAYVFVVAFSLPGATLLSVTGGFLFGLTLGTGLNVLAAVAGSAVIFLAVRMGFGEMLARRIDARDGTLRRIHTRLLEAEASVMLFLRLVPVFPFFLVNLLSALAGVRFVTFLWTTAVGILPGVLVYTWIGVGLGEVFDRGEDPDLSLLWEPQIIGPILGLALIAGLPIAFRFMNGKGA